MFCLQAARILAGQGSTAQILNGQVMTKKRSRSPDRLTSPRPQGSLLPEFPVQKAFMVDPAPQTSEPRMHPEQTSPEEQHSQLCEPAQCLEVDAQLSAHLMFHNVESSGISQSPSRSSEPRVAARQSSSIL